MGGPGAQTGVTAEELDRIKTYLTGAYPLRFDGNGAIAGIMASMQFQGFGIDYVNIRNDLIDAVTLDDGERGGAAALPAGRAAVSCRRAARRA